MANKANLTLRMEPELKAQAQELFKALGLDLSTATGLFFRQALRVGGLPFEVKAEIPNEVTRAAIEEVQELKRDPHKKTYGSFAELLGDMGE